MKTRQLGKRGPQISVVGFGAWAIGGGGWAYAWGPQDDQESIRVIHEAIDHGINWIDTAAVYGLGHSERIVGQAIADRRDQVLVATKCSLIWDENKKITKDHSPKSVRAEIEASLTRLNISVIDLYQIHWPPRNSEQIVPALEVIKEAVEAGKIRYVGVSNFTPAQIEIAKSVLPIHSLQPPYSLLVRDIEGAHLPLCVAQEIGVVIYSPMQSGLLTGKFTRPIIAKLADDDWRKNLSDQFKDPKLTANFDFIEALKPIAEESSCSLGQLAVAWTLQNPAVTSAIVGARKRGQIAETAKAAEITLSPEQMAKIEDLCQARNAQLAASS